MKTRVKSSRRQAKTPRGEDVMDKVVEAAVRLLSDRWLDEVSVTKLAEEAGVVRASLLLQFPQGWSDVVTSVLMHEFDTEYVNRVLALGMEETKRPVRDLLFETFDTFLTKAENSGLLYANLRSQMFVLGDENAAVIRVNFVDLFAGIVMMFERVNPDGDYGSYQYAADMLLNFALDLAGKPSFSSESFTERRETLQTMIDVTIAGMEQ